MSEHDPLDDPNDPDEILKELDSLKGLLGEGERAAAAADADEWDPDVFPDSADESTAASPAETGSDEPEVTEWDLDDFLDAGDEEPAESPEQPADDFETELSAFLEPEEGPAAAAEAPTAEANAADEENAGEVPVLEDVVFRGDDVPGEAVGLMSALSAVPDDREAAERTDTGPAMEDSEAAEPAEPEAAVEEVTAGAEPEPVAEETAPPAEPELAAEPMPAAATEETGNEAASDAAATDPDRLEAMAEAIVDRRLEALREQIKAEVVAELQRQLGSD